MALTVRITGDLSADRDDQKMYMAAVIDDETGQAPVRPVTLTWAASHGRFVGGNMGKSVTWEADIAGTDAVAVMITCTATIAADPEPTSSGPSLSALAEIGITGVLVNMFLTALGNVASNTNNILYNTSTGALDANSDAELSSDLDIFQLRWDNTVNEFVLNSTGGGHLANFFIGNTDQSVYLIFEGGTYVELTPTDFANAIGRGDFWARWQVTDAAILSLLNNLSTTSDLVVGVADSGSIGLPGDSGSGQATVSVAQNTPLTITIPGTTITVQMTVPATATSGQTVNLQAVVSEGNSVTGEWSTTDGIIANATNLSTTLTLPDVASGVVAVTFKATDALGATASATAYVTVGDPNANIFTPAIRIEIQGVDVTDRRIPGDGLNVGKSLDYPELLTFRSAGISFNLDNEDGAFEYSNPNNFFVSNGLPAHGRGAQVLVELGLSKNELMPVFAGEISEVVTSLGSTKARIKTRDLSVRSRQKVIENFGTELTRPITDYEGVAIDYTSDNPVFYFPIWGLPISPNSVSLIVNGSDGNDIDINIVEAIKTEGVLSNRNAEIDYARGLIRFEAEPDDGAETRITATWKRDFRYKRPDFLIRQILKNTGVQDTLGITDDTAARFAIEQALVRHLTDNIFSSHGRPYFEREGIVRWMKHNPDDDKWLMSIDNRLVEYDEVQDDYSEVSQIPDDEAIEATPPGGYGAPVIDKRVYTDGSDFNRIFAIQRDVIYSLHRVVQNRSVFMDDSTL